MRSTRKSQAQARAEDRILAITSGAGRRSRPEVTGVPDVYRSLLSEASDPSKLDGPSRKRRRVGEGSRAQPMDVDDAEDDIFEDVPIPGNAASNPQTVVDSDHSDHSEFDEWEEVGNATVPAADQNVVDDGVGDVTVEVNANRMIPKRTRKKALTTADRTLALSVHKAHVLLLLFHAHVRNRWCSIKQVETSLRRILSAKVVALLSPQSNQVQLRQSESFLEGLKLATDIWNAKYKVTTFGLHRPKWADPDELSQIRERIVEDGESLTKNDFIKATKTLSGSQDLGNQLFCALLRAVGVEARLVCSLQPLPPSTVSQKLVTPPKTKPMKPRIYATFEHNDEFSTSDESNAKATGPRRRLGQPTLGGPVGNYQHMPTPAPKKKKKVRKLDYPVFWVEALNPAYSRWVAVDPMVTETVSRANKLEPPASYEGNTMSYVIAFEEDGFAKDVTRRYAKSFNAKTRKQRVESFPDGQRWFNRALKPFRRREIRDRDQIEEAELTKKEAQEGLPNNIQDFKDHPHYALERHLKRNEVIWPKREVGKTTAGKAGSLEPIYRRSDVQVVQSADKWYRQGREIKAGEQALKHVPARSRRQKSPYSDEEEPEMAALYAHYQTEEYVPPPVVRGKVPKNVYGNIDVYVPTMIPAGASHIRHPLAKKAAQVLSIDYADAVTGFQFKGRHGTAVAQGIITASMHKEAVVATIQGFLEAQQQSEDDARSAECLRLWRRFLLGLQIAERIGLSDIHAANAEQDRDFKQELDDAEDDHDDAVDAGGFFPDSGADNVAQPTGTSAEAHETSASAVLRTPLVDEETAVRSEGTPIIIIDSPHRLHTSEAEPIKPNSRPASKERLKTQAVAESSSKNDLNLGGGFVQEENHTGGGFIPTAEDQGGGFLPDENDDRGGGFMPDPSNTQDGIPVKPVHGHAPQSESEHEMDELFEEQKQDTQPPKAGRSMLSDSLGVDTQITYPTFESPDVEMNGEQLSHWEGGSESDKASLLSHDPEDEDADPDWLDG